MTTTSVPDPDNLPVEDNDETITEASTFHDVQTHQTVEHRETGGTAGEQPGDKDVDTGPDHDEEGDDDDDEPSGERPRR